MIAGLFSKTWSSVVEPARLCTGMMLILTGALLHGCAAMKEQDGASYSNQNVLEGPHATDTHTVPDTGAVNLSDDGAQEENDVCSLTAFHNGRGPMCLLLLAFLEGQKKEYPSLTVKEYLTTDPGSATLLREMESEYGSSTGASDSYGYLPITFIGGNAYSGFDTSVEQLMRADIEGVCR